MKKTILFAVLGLAPVFAQNVTGPLFSATATIQGGCIGLDPRFPGVTCQRPDLPLNPLVDVNDAYIRGTASVFVDCTKADTTQGKIQGNSGAGFFVDNFVQVTETPVTGNPAVLGTPGNPQQLCTQVDPVFGRCFGVTDAASTSWANGSLVGTSPLNYYLNIDPQPFNLVAGQQQVVKVQLMDSGAIYANSDIYLNAGSCSIPATVTLCHQPNTPAQQTKTVPNSAAIDHLGHGDYLGACGAPVTGIPMPDPSHNGNSSH